MFKILLTINPEDIALEIAYVCGEQNMEDELKQNFASSFLFITIFALLFPRSGFASQAWPNEPAGSTLVSDWPFDNIIGGPWYAPWGVAGKIVSDPTAPLSGPNVLKNTRNSTFSDETDLYCSMPMANQKEIYLGFWFKPSDPTCGSYNWFQKLAILNCAAPHIYTKMLGDLKSGYFTIIGHEERAVMVFDTANAHIAPDAGFLPNINGASFRVGQWHKMEIYAKSSTTPSSRDGIYAWWVDDTLRGHYTIMNFELPFREVCIGSVWDQIVPTLPGTEWIEYDHVRVSQPVNGEPRPAYLVISSLGVPAARKDVAYLATLQTLSMRTTQPFTWTISAGALPAGLSLNAATGVISGTPTCTGPVDFTIKVTDKSQPPLSAQKAFRITVSGSGCTSGMENSRELPIVSGKLKGKGIRVETKTGSVQFSLLDPGEYSLGVYDLSGREVWKQNGKAQSTNTKIQMNAVLNEGVHLVRLQQGSRTVSGKFIVVR